MAAQLEFQYSIMSADIDEKAFRDEGDDAGEIVSRLAAEKANAIMHQWVREDAFPEQGAEISKGSRFVLDSPKCHAWWGHHGLVVQHHIHTEEYIVALLQVC